MKFFILEILLFKIVLYEVLVLLTISICNVWFLPYILYEESYFFLIGMEINSLLFTCWINSQKLKRMTRVMKNGNWFKNYSWEFRFEYTYNWLQIHYYCFSNLIVPRGATSRVWCNKVFRCTSILTWAPPHVINHLQVRSVIQCCFNSHLEWYIKT